MSLGPNLKLGSLILIVVFAASALAMYGGATLVDREDPVEADDSATDGGDLPGGPVEVTLVAQSQQFDKRTINASAGEQVTVTVDNQDAGVLHNVSFYTNNQATQAIYAGELFSGVDVLVEEFTAPDAGTYFFRCDAHPDMNGSFIVR